jgi:uncharacterized protein
LNRLNFLKDQIKPFYKLQKDPAHDWNHVLRVENNGLLICQSENTDPELVRAAIYCHDLVNLPKDHPERKKASEYSANKAVPLLKELKYSEEEIQIICQGIIQHSFSRGEKPQSIIAQIVQDADRLDALGAIGIVRCAVTSAKLNSSLYHFEDPLGEKRILDDKKFMLDHYFSKLFLLPELMNTASAKKIAYERVLFMKSFLTTFSKEITLCGS